jgi:hypothetical protein
VNILGFEIRWPERVVSCGKNPPIDPDLDLLPGPHCDPLVLHHPLLCDYCARMNEAQVERIHRGINFTGERQLGRETCPAELRRKLDVIHAWPGNRPFKEDPS